MRTYVIKGYSAHAQADLTRHSPDLDFGPFFFRQQAERCLANLANRQDVAKVWIEDSYHPAVKRGVKRGVK